VARGSSMRVQGFPIVLTYRVDEFDRQRVSSAIPRSQKSVSPSSTCTRLDYTDHNLTIG